MPTTLIKTKHKERALKLLQEALTTLFPTYASKDEHDSIKMWKFQGKDKWNIFWGLIFDSNENINCYCCTDFASQILMRLHTLVYFPPHHKPSLRLSPTRDNLFVIQNHSEWVCTAPGSHETTGGGQIRHIPKSRETRPTQGICVTLIMTLFQRRSCLACHGHASLLISSTPSQRSALFFRNSN